MDKKVDLNAPRSNNGNGYQKKHTNRSFSYNNPSNNKDTSNSNTSEAGGFLKNAVSGAQKKVVEKALVMEGVPQPIAQKASEHADEYSAIGGMKTVPQLKRFKKTLLVIFGFVVFVIMVIIISLGDADGSGLGYGLYGYDYYGDVCKQVRYGGNLMNIEDYVAGVINAEVGGFTTETLKTFAVAARTFVIQNGTKVGSDIENCYYDATSVGQAYNPDSISRMVYDAVDATRGLIIVYGGEPLVYYDASCIYTASQANDLTSTSDYNGNNYYIRYGSKTIGGINFQPIPVAEASSVGSFNSYLSNERPCIGNHGWGMSQNGAFYLERSLGYTWKEIIDYYYSDEEEILSIYKGYGYSGEYPIEPNNELYRNLQFLIDESFTDFLASHGATIGDFNNHIRSSIESAGVGTRDGVIAAGVTLIGSLAEMGVKLNYQWGGKYAAFGTNPIWGTDADMTYLCGPDSYGRLYDSAKCFNNYRWHSLDCSGFVTWAVINGMQNTGITQSQISNSSKISLNSNEAVCLPGGVLESSGHIVLVVGIDDERKQYIVAESTGSNISTGIGGVKLSYYNYGVSGYQCGNLNEIYGD